MALDLGKLDTTGSGSKGAGAMAIYETTDNQAAVETDGYFDAAYDYLAGVHAILIKASDATMLQKVTRTAPTDVAIADLDAHS
jgi:hypothetical protein